MVAVKKIDSNVTGLRYAEEDSIGVLPGSPVWYPLEPNSYKDFGGQIARVARNPINDGRQLKKGVTTDLDASGGFLMDVTYENLQDILQGFFFADLRTKAELSVATVDGSGNDYEPASGGTGYQAGDLLFAKGFANAANNGLKLVTGSPVAASVAVTDTGLVAETGASGIISKVGHQFAAGEVEILVDPDGSHLMSNGVVATAVITPSDNPADGETVTIGSTVYTFETGAIDAPYKVDVGADVQATLVNLRKAINANGVAGTDYGAGTVAHPNVTATSDSTTLTITAKSVGAWANSIATTDTVDGGWAGATMSNGVGSVGFTKLGLIPGEWVFVGGDGGDEDFSTPANNGFARVKTITDTKITFDKTQRTMVTEAEGTLTVRLFFGRVLKNEQGDLIKRRTYQLERTLGAPDDSSTDKQGEYLVGSVPSQIMFDIKQADKITCDISFVAIDHEQVDAGNLKDGERPSLAQSPAYNTSSDFSRLKLSLAGDADIEPLFAFLQEASITINNNVSPNKAVGVLGAFDVSVGNFVVTGSVTGYFSDVQAVRAVRDNSDVTFDFHLASKNRGISLDIPLISLGDGRANVEQDQAIKIPLTLEAADGAYLDANQDHTLLMVFWDYLPTAAM